MSTRIDALADANPERFQVLTGRALHPDVDETLQAVVQNLAEQVKAPIALVSLVLARTQFFRAQVGLPPDLAAARSTDRDASFCQFVIRDGRPFVVEDARGDPGLPQELVERFGVRSYLGAPIHVGGVVVGSLCAIDTAPRAFSDDDRDVVDELAEVASRRMEQLSRNGDDLTDSLLTHASTPAFAELKGLLDPLAGNITSARVALADLGALVRLWFELPADLRGRAEAVTPALGSLSGASHAWADLAMIIDRIEAAEQQLRPVVVALEQLVMPADEASVQNIAESAAHLAHQRLKVIGGVQWDIDCREVCVAAPRMLAISTLAAALSLTAAFVRSSLRTGLRGHVRVEGDDVVFGVGGDGFDPSAVLGRMQAMLRGTPELGVAASADLLLLRLPVAKATPTTAR